MRPVFILLLAVLFVHSGVSAQRKDTAASKQVFTYVEQMPEFPGGMDKVNLYLAQNLHYPDSARLAGIQGRVVIKFQIDEHGNVSDAQVLRGLGGGCNEEAIRVISAMPRWKPGKIDGKPAKIHFTLPLTFRLDGDKPATDSITHQ